MTVASTCVLIACLLPVVCAGIAKSPGMRKSPREGGYDNANPRQWQAGLEGRQARALAAMQNNFEGLPFFIAGVLLAQQAGASQTVINAVAVAFVLSRLVYIGVYLANRATLRTAVWTFGMACCVALFLLPHA